MKAQPLRAVENARAAAFRVCQRPERADSPLLFAILLAISIAACKRQPPPPSPPPAAVTVAKPIVREVVEWDDYSGRLEAVETVEVRARVSGYIESADFVEGSLVKAGDLLFVIDPRPFEVELARAEAELTRAKASHSYASHLYGQVDRAFRNQAASENEREDARRGMLEAEAAVAAGESAVRGAKLDLEWSRVSAPISGRVSRKIVTPGNLITGGAGQASLLTTITSVDPIYCYVDADEQSVLKYQRMAEAGTRRSARRTRIPVYLRLADETGFPHAGTLDFVDNRLSPTTGTVRARGVFPNPDGWMLPGYFGLVRVPGSGRYEAILVPDAAVTSDLDQRRLLVVNADNVVETRPVELGALFGKYRAIKSGIGPADRVIINGLMHARPGATVAPQETTLSPDDVSLGSPGTPGAADSTQADPDAPASTPTGGGVTP